MAFRLFDHFNDTTSDDSIGCSTDGHPSGTPSTLGSKPESSGENSVVPQFPLRNPGTIVPPIKNLNLLVPQTDAQSLLAQNPDWETEFQCFDGKEGRPSLLQKVEEAKRRAYNNRYMPKEIEQTEEDRSFLREAFSRLTGAFT